MLIIHRILVATNEKLLRTKLLMETIEESIERGLDAELNYTEEITAAVLALITTLPSPGDTKLMKREIACAHDMLKDLKEASIKFMEVFHSASLLLNSSTNEVAIAEAKLAGSPKDAIEKMMKEKGIADQETDKELQERVGVVEGDFTQVDKSIETALKGLDEVVEDPTGGIKIDRVLSPVGAVPPKGPQGPKRAELSPLERAKLRNAGVGNQIPYS